MADQITIIQVAQKGDVSAYGEIVRRFQDMAYGYAYAILGDFQLAQDAAQEAFIEAYRQLADLKEPKAFPGWLKRIIFKHCDRLTRGKRILTVPLEEAMGEQSPMDGPDRRVERMEMKDEVLAAIQSLPDNQRVATTLFYINGYSQSEVADFLEVPVSTVKKRLHDSRRKLKERMMTMVKQALEENALPADFQLAIGKATHLRTTSPSLAWFRDRWVLVWQDGERGKRWDGPYWFMLAESRDGKKWSLPRRIDMPEQVQDKAKLCVWQDELFMLTHCHHNGLRLARSKDTEKWDVSAMMLGDVGRPNIFSDEVYLYIAYPHWLSADWVGDTVQLLQSKDGTSWRWLSPPCPMRGHNTQSSAGVACGDRIYVVWREWEEVSKVPPYVPKVVKVNWSDDRGVNWSKPVTIESLVIPEKLKNAFMLSMAVAPDGTLGVAQSVWLIDDNGWVRDAVVHVATSQDDGVTWPDVAQYKTGSLYDPAIAFAPNGKLLLAGSSGSEGGTQPWVVHSQLAETGE